MEIYGQAKPPKYDLSKIDIPVRLFYGKSDRLYKQKVYLDIFLNK
jgi:hypothetical protein